MKHCLQEITFPSREELHAAIREIVPHPEKILQGVFEHWKELLEWASQNNGGHCPYVQHWPI
jgi:hypothetical protein